MTGLPELGQKVKVYPAHGRKVQDGARPLDSGGRWLADDGREVKWSEYHLEQMRAGDLSLHPVAAPAEKADKKPAAKAKE